MSSVLLFLISGTGTLQAYKEEDVWDRQTISVEEQTIEAVLNTTEQMNNHKTTQNLMMTSERAEHNKLQVIGETINGNKIYSSASKEVVDEFIKNPQGLENFATAKSGFMVTWHGSYGTPMIWMDSIGWVYCMEPYNVYPTGQSYDEGTWANNPGLDAIGIWGFPRNHGGQHGLSDEEAYVRTFVALNAYIGTYNRQTIEGYGDVYVNMLLSKADAHDIPTDTYTVHTPSKVGSTFNKELKRIETDLFEITGAKDAKFWLEMLPDGFYMVGEDNKRYDSLTIPVKFRLVTDNLKYSGEITFDVKTNIRPQAGIEFRAQGVQTLFGLQLLDPLPAYRASATFTPATGGFRGKKEDTNGSLVTGAVFTLFEDEAGTKVVKDVNDNDVTVTTKDGKFEYSDDIVVGDYWLHEKKPDGSSGAPRGYWQLEKPVRVSIEAGGVIEVPIITNIFQERVQLVVKKMNEYDKPVTGLIFDVYRKGDDVLVDTVRTDGDGYAYSKFLPANRINPETGAEEKIEYYAVERQHETYVPIKYVDFPLETRNDEDQIIVELVNYHLRLNVDGFKVDEEGNFLPGTLYRMEDAQGRQLAVSEVDKDGKFSFQNVRFDLFFNTTDKTSQYADTYVREVKTSDEDKFALDDKKYYLPNLEDKFEDYKMGDVITLSTNERPFVNEFLRGTVDLVKVDEQDNEKVLPNAKFKFERLTGREAHIVDGSEEDENDDEANLSEEKASTDAPIEVVNNSAKNDIDVKQLFELTTDADGRIIKGSMLYGEWCVTEIEAPDGYILPVDTDGTLKNKLCFTIKHDTKKISLKFYNQKQPELLVSTGNNLPGLFTALGVSIVLLSLALLLYVKKQYVAKKAMIGFVSVAVLGVSLLGGTTLWATEALELSAGELLAIVLQQKNRAVYITTQSKIDPLDDEDGRFDPIEDEAPVEDEVTLEGDKQGSNGEHVSAPNGLSEDSKQGDVEAPKKAIVAKHQGWLVSTGLNNWGYIIGLVLVGIGAITGMYVIRRRRNQEVEIE